MFKLDIDFNSFTTSTEDSTDFADEQLGKDIESERFSTELGATGEFSLIPDGEFKCKNWDPQ